MEWLGSLYNRRSKTLQTKAFCLYMDADNEGVSAILWGADLVLCRTRTGVRGAMAGEGRGVEQRWARDQAGAGNTCGAGVPCICPTPFHLSRPRCRPRRRPRPLRQPLGGNELCSVLQTFHLVLASLRWLISTLCVCLRGSGEVCEDGWKVLGSFSKYKVYITVYWGILKIWGLLKVYWQRLYSNTPRNGLQIGTLKTPPQTHTYPYFFF